MEEQASRPETQATEDKSTAPSGWGRRLWQRAIAFLEALAKQHHVIALRDGMISSVPVILVGSTFLLLGSQGEVLKDYFAGTVSWLPNLVDTAFGAWYEANVPLILLPYRVTMGALALYIAFTIACALAVQYKMAPIPQGLGAVAALLITDTPVRLVTEAASTKKEWLLALKPLGPEGIFLAIIMAIAMVEISRLMSPQSRSGQAKPENHSQKPEQKTQGEEEEEKGAIPPSVIAAFSSFLPMLILVFVVWAIRHVADWDIQAAILSLMKPLSSLGDSLPAVLASNFFLHLFAVAGVHGISVINAVMLPLWQQYVAANAEAHAAGLPLPHVTAYPFYQWFIWVGGSGATLAPTFLLLFFKNAKMQKIGRISIIPALFNVNEPFLFGLPVVANPILAIPCIIAPLVCGVVAWLAVTNGWVTAPFLEVPWVMPCFLGALLSTQDLRSLLLLAINIAISGVIWYPFLRAYSRDH